jgi:hypothetical protein
MTSNLRHRIGSGIGRASAIAVVTIVVLTLAACGGAAPSAACGLGGTADQAAFERSFSSMVLVDAAGKPGLEDPDGSVIFGASARVVVRLEATTATEARFCVAVRDGSGTIVADQTARLGTGAGQVDLGPFPARDYVIRVGVGGVLVRNLPFAIR